MKTYIVLTTKGSVAVMANNKNDAHSKVTEKGYKANKGQVVISSVHYDYVQSATKL